MAYRGGCTRQPTSDEAICLLFRTEERQSQRCRWSIAADSRGIVSEGDLIQRKELGTAPRPAHVHLHEVAWHVRRRCDDVQRRDRLQGRLPGGDQPAYFDFAGNRNAYCVLTLPS